MSYLVTLQLCNMQMFEPLYTQSDTDNKKKGYGMVIITYQKAILTLMVIELQMEIQLNFDDSNNQVTNETV